MIFDHPLRLCYDHYGTYYHPKQQKKITYKFIVGYDFYVYFHNKNKFSYGFQKDWFDGRKYNIFWDKFLIYFIVWFTIYTRNKIQENWIAIISMKIKTRSLKEKQQKSFSWGRVKFYFYPSNMRVMVWKIMKGKYTTIWDHKMGCSFYTVLFILFLILFLWKISEHYILR